MSKSGHYVYRILDARGRCLYVGRTMNPEIRMKSHERTQVWAGEMAGVEFSGPYSLADAAVEEVRTIHRDRPAYNHAELPEFLAARQVAHELRRGDTSAIWDLVNLGLSIDEAAVVHEMRRQEKSRATSAN